MQNNIAYNDNGKVTKNSNFFNKDYLKYTLNNLENSQSKNTSFKLKHKIPQDDEEDYYRETKIIEMVDDCLTAYWGMSNDIEGCIYKVIKDNRDLYSNGKSWGNDKIQVEKLKQYFQHMCSNEEWNFGNSEDKAITVQQFLNYLSNKIHSIRIEHTNKIMNLLQNQELSLVNKKIDITDELSKCYRRIMNIVSTLTDDLCSKQSRLFKYQYSEYFKRCVRNIIQNGVGEMVDCKDEHELLDV